jgi:hypothetical protein
MSSTPLPYTAPRPRRRSSGCGCGCGCLSTLFAIVIAAITIGAVGLGVYASRNPQAVASWLADPQKTINDLLSQLKGAAQGGPQFTSYSPPASTISSGGSFNVSWSTNGADVHLQQLNSAGAVFRSISVPSSGSYFLKLTGSPGESVSYRLLATLNGQSATRTFTITLR